MVAVLVITYAAWLTQFISEHIDLRARFLSLPVYAKGFCYAASVMCMLIFSSGIPQPFIYFRF
jgi:hypothetical protein